MLEDDYLFLQLLSLARFFGKSLPACIDPVLRILGSSHSFIRKLGQSKSLSQTRSVNQLDVGLTRSIKLNYIEITIDQQLRRVGVLHQCAYICRAAWLF